MKQPWYAIYRAFSFAGAWAEFQRILLNVSRLWHFLCHYVQRDYEGSSNKRRNIEYARRTLSFEFTVNAIVTFILDDDRFAVSTAVCSLCIFIVGEQGGSWKHNCICFLYVLRRKPGNMVSFWKEKASIPGPDRSFFHLMIAIRTFHVFSHVWMIWL